MSIKELSGYIESIKSKCLEKFDIVENRKEQRLVEMVQQSEEKCARIKREMEKLEKRENELIEINKNLKLNRQISELEINELQRCKGELT